jgi:hypothetical protein
METAVIACSTPADEKIWMRLATIILTIEHVSDWANEGSRCRLLAQYGQMMARYVSLPNA